MSSEPQDETGSSYDTVADEYVRRIFRELEGKPFDRELLTRFAAGVREGGLVADVGCGPGHVGRYLHEHGVRVCGVDLSGRMVERARSLNPGIEFIQGDMRALPVRDGAWTGIVAFYSLIHVPRDQITRTLREFKRVLRPAGGLLVAFHVGDHVLHLDELWERKVSLDFTLFEPGEMAGYLAAAGFKVREVLEREPYPPDVEHQSRRCYVLAESPAVEAEPSRGHGAV